MLKKDRDKTNLKILSMLREKGAPSLTPFPGEQDFQSKDLDLDQMGDVLISGPTSEEKPEELRKRRRKMRQEDPTEFLQSEESVQISGTN
jgi:hypothetical protein